MTAVPLALLAAQERPWTEIGGVQFVGLILGAAFLLAAIRAMFGRGGRR